MNNINAKAHIEVCQKELERVNEIILKIGHMAPEVPFLTNYALIRTCGIIELCFKTIIADLHVNHNLQISNYIENTIRNSSMNPSMENICKTLKKFDENWNINFKKKLKELANSKKINTSLSSLNNARNSFAHGGATTSSFENIKEYFNDSVQILLILDEVVTTT